MSDADFISKEKCEETALLLEEALVRLTLSDTEFARYEHHYHIAPKIHHIRTNIGQALARVRGEE